MRRCYSAMGDRMSMPSGDQERRVLLVVEGEPLARADIAGFLRDKGFKVLEAVNATEAFLLIAVQPIDAVFSEICLPGKMDGAELAGCLCQSYPDLPIILTSGNSGMAQAVRASEAVPFIMKPYAPPEVARRIETLLAEVDRNSMNDQPPGEPARESRRR